MVHTYVLIAHIAPPFHITSHHKSPCVSCGNFNSIVDQLVHPASSSLSLVCKRFEGSSFPAAVRSAPEINVGTKSARINKLENIYIVGELILRSIALPTGAQSHVVTTRIISGYSAIINPFRIESLFRLRKKAVFFLTGVFFSVVD